jgi:hypothetical protein
MVIESQLGGFANSMNFGKTLLGGAAAATGTKYAHPTGQSLDKGARLMTALFGLATAHRCSSNYFFSPMSRGSPKELRESVNCTPISNALNTIVIKGQKSSRQLQFECESNHDLTRLSAEKRDILHKAAMK